MFVRAKLAWFLVLAALVMGPSRSEAGTLYAADSGGGTSKIFALDSTTGAVLSSFTGPGIFADAVALAPDAMSLFILDSGPFPGVVYHTSLTGTVLSSFTLGLDVEGLDVLHDGRLVVGGGTSGVIALVSPMGTVLSSFAPVASSFGIATDGVGTIFALRITGEIDAYSLTGTHLGTVVSGVTGTTLGLAYTGSSFFVSSIAAGSIFEVGLGGGIIRSFASPGTFTEGLDIQAGVTAIPEPSTFVLGCTALLMSAGLRLRSRRNKAEQA